MECMQLMLWNTCTLCIRKKDVCALSEPDPKAKVPGATNVHMTSGETFLVTDDIDHIASHLGWEA
jgi:hypothetical protein